MFPVTSEAVDNLIDGALGVGLCLSTFSTPGSCLDPLMVIRHVPRTASLCSFSSYYSIHHAVIAVLPSGHCANQNENVAEKK